MKIYRTKRFRKQFAQLSPEGQSAVQRALRYFTQPGRIQPLRRFPNYYELRAGLKWRVIWFYGDDGIVILRTVKLHDRALARP